MPEVILKDKKWKARNHCDPEAKVEKYLTDQVNSLGGICWKFTSPGTTGVPDRIVILNGKTFYVELKRPKGGRISAIQKWRIKQLIMHDQKVYVIKNVDEASEMLKTIMQGDIPCVIENAQRNGVYD